jgi:hypothetical protein
VWRHILKTKYRALQAQAVNEGGMQEYLATLQDYCDPIFFRASDAAFADDVETLRSSQGYVFQLFGMTVDWKSTIQRTVTKSTTEAELLALSLAGSEMEEWCRLLILILILIFLGILTITLPTGWAKTSCNPRIRRLGVFRKVRIAQTWHYVLTRALLANGISLARLYVPSLGLVVVAFLPSNGQFATLHREGRRWGRGLVVRRRVWGWAS